MGKNKNIDLLVISCDTYSDIWDTFFDTFFRYWQDCPLDIHLISNSKSYNHSEVHPIKVGQDISWSDNLLNAHPFGSPSGILILFAKLVLCINATIISR